MRLRLGKFLWRGKNSQRKFGNDGASASNDLLGERFVLLGIDHVYARSPDRDRRALRCESAFVRRSIDPTGHAAENDEASVREVARKHFGHAGSIWRGMACAYDGDRRKREQLRIAAEPEDRWRIEYLAETFGISVVGVGEKLAAGFRERFELLIGRRVGMALSDELDARDRKLQGFKIGETTFDDFGSRPAALNGTQDSAWT
jgi:hypothetical protein